MDDTSEIATRTKEKSFMVNCFGGMVMLLPRLTTRLYISPPMRVDQNKEEPHSSQTVCACTAVHGASSI